MLNQIGNLSTYRRIFITGMTGCGKTTLAEAVSEKSEHQLDILDFDTLYCYSNPSIDAVYSAMEGSENFVIDALPLDGTEECAKRLLGLLDSDPEKTAVVLVLCDKTTWIESRIPEKRKLAGYTGLKTDEVALYHFDEFHSGPASVVSTLSRLLERTSVPTFVYHSVSGKLECLNWSDHQKRAERLLQMLESASYDKNYQNIDFLGKKGYDDSAPSWEKMKQMPVSFHGKTVCDLGCFHGFYSIKAALSGASRVIGLDRSSEMLEVSGLIAQCSGVDAEFEVWEGGQPTPECDIALVLNMLHHCPDQARTLENIRCKEAIFEINQEQLPLVSEYFDLVDVRQGREYPSRPARLLVAGTKKLTKAS